MSIYIRQYGVFLQLLMTFQALVDNNYNGFYVSMSCMFIFVFESVNYTDIACTCYSLVFSL